MPVRGRTSARRHGAPGARLGRPPAARRIPGPRARDGQGRGCARRVRRVPFPEHACRPQAGKSGAAPIPPASPEPTRPLDFSDIHGCETAKRAVAVAVAVATASRSWADTAPCRAAIAARNPVDNARHVGRRRARGGAHPLRLRGTGFLHSGGEQALPQPRAPASAPPGSSAGGRPVRPGEVSLAHAGVLYLDDAAEWDRVKLQMMRMPMEEGAVRIVRADGACSMPARFQLVVGADSCPCGGYGRRDARVPLPGGRGCCANATPQLAGCCAPGRR